MDYEASANDLWARLKENPDDIILMTHLASALMEITEFTSSLEWLKLAAKKKPCVQTLTNLAYFYLTEGEPVGPLEWRYRERKAARVITKAIAMNPASYFPYAILGTAFMKMDQPGRALPAFEKAVAIEATAVNLNNLGAAHYGAGKVVDAIPHFSRVCSMDLPADDAMGAQISLGFCLALTGQVQQAVLLAEGLIERADLWLPDVAGIFYTAGANEQAMAVFADCMTGPFSKTLYWIEPYMCALATCGRLAEAEAVRDRVLKESSEWIADLREDLKQRDPDAKDDFSAFKRRGLPATIRAEEKKMGQTWKAFKRAVSGHRLAYDFRPRPLQECWFFGCLRHGNPDYAG